MPQLALFIVHRTAAGQRDDVRAVWEEHMAPAISANAGHLAYFYTFDDADQDVIRVFQLYRDQAASEDFLKSPAYAAYLAAVEPLLSGPPEIFTTRPQWAKAAAAS
jgi:quinol monooxygenase YgiN